MTSERLPGVSSTRRADVICDGLWGRASLPALQSPTGRECLATKSDALQAHPSPTLNCDVFVTSSRLCAFVLATSDGICVHLCDLWAAAMRRWVICVNLRYLRFLRAMSRWCDGAMVRWCDGSTKHPAVGPNSLVTHFPASSNDRAARATLDRQRRTRRPRMRDLRKRAAVRSTAARSEAWLLGESAAELLGFDHRAEPGLHGQETLALLRVDLEERRGQILLLAVGLFLEFDPGEDLVDVE